MSTPLLSVVLEYYSGQKKLLSQGAYETLGTAERVTTYQKHSTIPTPDFLNYFMIGRDKIDAYSTYSKRLERIERVIGWLVGGGCNSQRHGQLRTWV